MQLWWGPQIKNYCPRQYVYTDQHEQAGQQEVDEVPQQGGEPEVGEVDPADLLHVLGLHRPLRDEEQGKGAG